MKFFIWNKNNRQTKNVLAVFGLLFLMTACSSKFKTSEQKILAPVSQHQSIYVIKYETPQKWLDYDDLRDGVFSKWILQGFEEVLSNNNIEVDGIVYTKAGKKSAKKEIKAKFIESKPEGLLSIKPISAHGKMETQSTHHVDNIIYKLEFFSYKTGKKVKVWESKGDYQLSDSLEDDPEKLYHAYADVFVNQVLTELQEVGLLKSMTLFEIK